MNALLRRRMMMAAVMEGEDEMTIWRFLGEKTVEEGEESNSVYIEIPEDIEEVLVVATQTGGDTEAQNISVFAWKSLEKGYIDTANTFSAVLTGTSTTNQRCICRLRKIQLETGEVYADLISSVRSGGASASSTNGASIYSGNRLGTVEGNLVGFRKDATSDVIPVGFSFYVLGR